MRGATDVIQQRHQVLRLPRKMTRIIDPRDIWNVIYNARSNRHHPPTSPNTAPATQNCTLKSKKNLPKTVEASFTMRSRFDHDPNMIRPWNCKTDPVRSYFSPLGNEICSENYNISPSGYLPRFHRILRLPQKVTLQDHQILRLPRKVTLQDHQMLCLSRKMTRIIDRGDIWHVIYNARSHPPTSPSTVPCLPREMTRIIDPRDIWNVINNARSNRHHPPTSPNTAPSTRNCTPKFQKNLPKTVEASFTMRGRFDDDPNMIRPWNCKTDPVRSYFSPLGNEICSENYNISPSGYLPRFHRILRLPQKVTLQDHQILRLPRRVTLQDHQMLCLSRKMTRIIDRGDIWHVIYNARSHPPTSPSTVPCLPRKMTRIIDPDIWNVIYNARSNRHHPPTSPNTAPSTQNCIPKSKKNLPKTVYTMRGRFDDDPNMIRTIRPWNCKTEPVRSQSLLFPPPQRILYWKLQHFALRQSTQISPNTAPATKSDTPRSPKTAPATKSDTPRSPNAAPATKSDTPRSPNTAPATKSDTPRSPNTAPALKSDTEVLLYWAVTLLSCYFTELLL